MTKADCSVGRLLASELMDRMLREGVSVYDARQCVDLLEKAVHDVELVARRKMDLECQEATSAIGPRVFSAPISAYRENSAL